MAKKNYAAAMVTTNGEEDMNEGEVKVFVYCLIFSIIFMIVFAGAVSYLYILFKNYLDSLA